MCGRFALNATGQDILDVFGVDRLPDLPHPLVRRYNVAPTQEHLVVRSAPDGGRVLVVHRWGLLPRWAKDRKLASKLINARADTVFEKPSFKSAARRQRCLVPATGFYEWQAPESGGGRKLPWHIGRPDGGLLALAGLWEQWRDPSSGDDVLTFTILTTDANATVAPVHRRMPIFIAPEHWDLWLDRRVTDPSAIEPLLVPVPEGLLVARRVGFQVNNVRNDDPSCLEPPEDE